MPFTDQLHRTINLPNYPPQRIISLVPSQTELLAYLGLETEVVGITKFCVHPEHWFKEKTRIGGTKTLNLEKVAALMPDLILGNKEENDRGQIEWLAQRFPVWMSDICTLKDACAMIGAVGELTGKTETAFRLVGEITAAFEMLPVDQAPLNTAYIIWRKPIMVAASGTFTSDIMERAGFRNAFATRQRYPEVSAEQLREAAPELILLSSEPYPFAEKHLAEFREICPGVPVRLVDGEMFSWYGSRLLLSGPYLKSLREWSRFAKG